ncbi:MAG TPA: hypothetical protein VN039_09745, partial [Nitrospira sp.]|nr:hypothetical protein [Nitrospira sp.]
IADFANPRVRLESRFGGFELAFDFQGRIFRQEVETDARRYVAYGAWLRLQLPGQAVDLGYLRPLVPVVMQQLTHETICNFSLAMDCHASQIEIVETYRNGGGLELSLQIHGLSSRPPIAFDREETQSTPAYLSVPQSDWIKQLNRSGAGMVMLSEIHFPSVDRNALAHPGRKHLLDAQTKFLAGDWTGCVAECRKVAEAFGDRKLGKIKASFIKESGIMPKTDRLTMLLVAVEHCAHVAAHATDGSPQEDFTRSEALLLLRLTSSYVMWLAEYENNAKEA